jgi:uracil phosphoribosyltransferase
MRCKAVALNTTHWALKDVDLLPVLIEAGLLSADMIEAQPADSRIKTIGVGQPPAEVEARPSVFRLPKEASDNKLVSVMMPFNAGFNSVYDAIQKAAKSAGMTCEPITSGMRMRSSKTFSR